MSLNALVMLVLPSTDTNGEEISFMGIERLAFAISGRIPLIARCEAESYR